VSLFISNTCRPEPDCHSIISSYFDPRF
jgi:hypothetical protein